MFRTLSVGFLVFFCTSFMGFTLQVSTSMNQRSVDVSVTDTCDASWPVAASASNGVKDFPEAPILDFKEFYSKPVAVRVSCTGPLNQGLSLVVGHR